MKNISIYSSDDELEDINYTKSDDSVDDNTPTTYTTTIKPKPLVGANITRISLHAGIDLALDYWLHIQPTLTNHTIFVGDVHADINQFIAPLVMSGLITLTGELALIPNEQAYKSTIFAKTDKDEELMNLPHYDELTLFVPKYTINKTCTSKIIYLGDLIHEWIFGRVVMYMLHDLLNQVPDNIVYIYGNHDLNVLAIYPLYRRRLINMGNIMQTTYDTMAKELNMYKSVHFYQFKVDFNGDELLGQVFTYAYLAHIFEPLYDIFVNRRGRLSHYINIDNVPFIVSHCVWDLKWIPNFIDSKASGMNNNLSYVHYSVYSRVTDYKAKPESKEYLLSLHSCCKSKSGPSPTSVDITKLTERKLKGYEYRELSEAMNDIIDGSQFIALTNNIMLKNRVTYNMFVNQITGHTPGGSWRDIGANVGHSTFYEERLKKLTPELHNERYLFYWDFNASAGYDKDEFSRPDFVYVANEHVNVQTYSADEINDTNELPESIFEITNLPAFNYIVSNNKDSMMVYSKKSKHTGASRKIAMDPTSSDED